MHLVHDLKTIIDPGTSSLLPTPKELNQLSCTLDLSTLDSEWWYSALGVIVDHVPETSIELWNTPSTFFDILSRCNIKDVQLGMVRWVQGLRAETRMMGDEHHALVLRDFQRTLGSICFLANPYPYHRRRKAGSPISEAYYRSVGFFMFRGLLRESGFNIDAAIKEQVLLFPDGWTEITMKSLFDFEFQPVGNIFSYCCRRCRKFASSVNEWSEGTEVPWARKIQRLKDSMDPNGPLTEEESKDEERWNYRMELRSRWLCEACDDYNKGEIGVEQESSYFLFNLWD